MIRISNYPARTPTDSGNAAEFRRWADDCATQAADPRATTSAHIFSPNAVR